MFGAYQRSNMGDVSCVEIIPLVEEEEVITGQEEEDKDLIEMLKDREYKTLSCRC